MKSQSKIKQNLYMTHSVSGNTRSNASAFSHCSVQGHHHSEYGISYHGDHANLRWSMSVGCLADPNSVAMRYGRKFVKRRPILGMGAVIGSEVRIMVISDTHAPYHHSDAMRFILACAEDIEPNLILHVGDISDNHTVSYHESETDAYSPMDELERAIEFCQELESHFPKMLISEGNHDLLTKRKAKSCGIPAHCLRSYNDNFGVGQGWQWAESHYIPIGDAQPVLYPMLLNAAGRWVGRVL